MFFNMFAPVAVSARAGAKFFLLMTTGKIESEASVSPVKVN